MGNDVIHEKLESLRRCIDRIESKVPRSSDQLIEDYDLQDIICVNLERAVQLSVDIASHAIAESDRDAPATMAESFTTLATLNIISGDLADRMRKAVGFRNIAVHAYEKVNWKIVYSIIANDLGDFNDFSRCVYEYVENPASD